MKQSSASYLPLLLLLAATSVADDKSVSSTSSHTVQLDKCHITLKEHVTLASDRNGIVKTAEYEEGQSVKKGCLVVLIADEVAQANLAAAKKKASNENELNFARIAKKQADSEHDRMVKANEEAEKRGGQKPVAQVEVDKAQLAADKAGISIIAAEHEISLNKLNAAVTEAELRTYSVLAEFDGTVTKMFKKKGEAVRQGDPVAEIVNPKHVRIEGYVPLKYLRYVKEGAKVRVRLSETDLDHLGYQEEDDRKPFEGQITFVDEVSDPIDGTTRIFAEVENREKVEKQVKVESRVKFILRAGLEANMDIFVDDEPTTARSQPTKDLENARKELTPTSDQK